MKDSPDKNVDKPAKRTARGSLSVDSPAKRAKLPPQRNPRWSPVAGARGGLSLGYRRTTDGPGTWVVRLIENKRRFEERLAFADDKGAGSDALAYPQAVAAALAWAQRKLAGIADARDTGTDRAEPTVRDAVSAYVTARERRPGRGKIDVASRMRVHVLSDDTFASTRLAKLTPETLTAWVDRLRRKTPPPARPTRDKAALEPRPLAPSTINRTLNDVRAALNRAAEIHGRKLPADIVRSIRVGTRGMPDATEARRQILVDADVRRLVAAAFATDETGDFGRLVALLAATGARFSQVAALKVADVQLEARRVLMPPTLKGRATKSRASRPVPLGDDVIAMLRPCIARRPGHAPLLERWRSRQTGPVEWERIGRGQWTTASEMTRAWRLTVEIAGLPHGTIPYSLRHSSIVRQLRAGVPIRLVASVHDTSVAMIERHYSAFVSDVADDLVRAALTPVAPAQPRALRTVQR